MFNKILVAVDGSKTSGRGLKTAVDLAKDQGAQLLVLHVVDERTPLMYPEAGLFIDQVLEALTDSGKKILAGVQKEVSKQGGQCSTRMVETMGLPVADVIVDEARKWRADLIVLGTHGRRGMSRMVMGSDAEGVVRMAKVPVMLVRSPEPKPRKAAKAK